MKIVHLADLHLGYRAYNKLSEHGFNLREVDVLAAFRESLRKIIEISPSLIIMAGDIFHKPRPSNLTIFQTIQSLILFRQKCNAPIVIVSGNHESVKTLESGNVLNILEGVIPNLKVIDGSIKEVELKEIDTLFVGVPYNALPELKNKNLVSDKNFKYNVLSVHGSFDSIKCPELSKYGNEELLTSEKLNANSWDYVAFGHYHNFTQLDDNIYYSGAIERTTSNVWQEADIPKGFIEYDLDKKECVFHKLEKNRKVYDIQNIDVMNLSTEEINAKIETEMSKIKDVENAIIRMTLENIDNIQLKELDYKKIREFKKKAVHFRLNTLKKDSSIKYSKNNNNEAQKNIYEYLDEEVKSFELSNSLDKEKFKQLALKYLQEEQEVL